MVTTPTDASRPARAERAGTPWFAWALAACVALALAGSFLRRADLQLAAASVLLLAWLPRAWRRRSPLALVAWLAAAAWVAVPAALGRVELAWSLLPVAFPAAVAWLFARTLRRGREPLVTRCVRVIEGEAQAARPRVAAYTRGVTRYWAWLLALVALLSLAIALFAAPGGWLAALGVDSPVRIPGRVLAWYPETGCWALLAAGFAGEYAFRRWRLRDVPQASLARFIGQLLRRWPELAGGGERAP